MLEIMISQEEIEQAIDRSSERLNNTIYGFRNFFNNLYNNRISKESLEAIIRFERFIGTQRCIKERCTRALRIENDRELTVQEDHHLNLYSLKKAAESVMDHHDRVDTDTLSFDYHAGEYSLTDSIIRGYMEGARRKRDILPQYTEDLMSRILQETSVLLKHEDLIRVSLNDTKAAMPKVKHTEYSELIGVDEAAQALRYTISRLCCYDPGQNRNIYAQSLPRSMLLYGPPGTGKTSLVDASIGLAESLSCHKGMPFNLAVIDNSLKSMWMGKSVEIIRRQIENARSPGGIGLVIIDDFDMVLSSRSAREQNFGELQVLHEILNQISGYGRSDIGNHMYLLTSNMPGAADHALYDRIDEKILVKGCTQRSEYRALLMQKLGGYGDFADQEAIEQLAMDLERTRASGRTVSSMAKAMIKLIDPRIPDKEFICAPYSMQTRQINGYRRISMQTIDALQPAEVTFV